MTNEPARVAVTGTPGVGKTTVTDRLDSPVCHLNRAIREQELTDRTDTDRESLVADMDAVEAYVDRWVADRTDADRVVIESHLAHHLHADRVVVLRCRPDLLADRLAERGEPAASVRENRNSEALDVIAGEAADAHPDAVYEIDTTERDPAEIATAVRAVIENDREPAVGTVDFLSYLAE